MAKQQTTPTVTAPTEEMSIIGRFTYKFNNLPAKEQVYWLRLGITFLIASLLGIANVRGFWGFLVFFVYQPLTALWFQRKYPDENYTFKQAQLTGLITSLFLYVFSWTFWFNLIYASTIVPNWQNI